ISVIVGGILPAGGSSPPPGGGGCGTCAAASNRAAAVFKPSMNPSVHSPSLPLTWQTSSACSTVSMPSNRPSAWKYCSVDSRRLSHSSSSTAFSSSFAPRLALQATAANTLAALDIVPCTSSSTTTCGGLSLSSRIP